MDTYEEKYKEALERAKHVHSTNLAENKKSTEYIFPELKEIEDENIRKELIDFVNANTISNDSRREKYIAWLEKQGEQKSADKVVPMFNVGDWIVKRNGESFYNGKMAVQIKYIDGRHCWFDDNTWIGTEDIRLWTLKDAKDGDVLVDNERPFIFRGLLDNEHPEHPTAYCGIDTSDTFIRSSGNHWWTANKNDIKPANIKERVLLFQAMKKAGYKWNKNINKLEK